MSIQFQSHGGGRRQNQPEKRSVLASDATIPAAGDVAADARGDLGYLFPPSGNPDHYLPDTVLAELDELGDLMVPAAPNPDDPAPADITATPDSTLPPVMTYWGQFLDHELTARTDRDTDFSKLHGTGPTHTAEQIEQQLKNARSPRFDLDSVYGGLPLGSTMTADQARDTAKIIAGMRHPHYRNKMRVGPTVPHGHLPDNLDPYRDLPRFSQVEPHVRDAFLRLAESQMEPADFEDFKEGLPKRAIIGDMRNDENLLIAQFHLSFLRFHNRAVDYLAAHDTGWPADYSSAKALTTLHYQWLLVEQFLMSVCDPAVVQRIKDDKAKHFFEFRDAYNARNGTDTLGDVIPLEFSAAVYRFGHTMVRNAYDLNKNFGRPGTHTHDAKFERIFLNTGGGGFRETASQDKAEGKARLPQNMIVDWSRYVIADPDTSDGFPARTARSIDTLLAPPLGDLVNEGDKATDAAMRALERQLARRNLRRGFALRLPTGQALHKHLQDIGAVLSGPIADITTALDNKPDLAAFLQGSASKLHERTPLWFYILAEAEAAGGNHLGEVGSWITASCFLGALLDDPESAVSIGFGPSQSPLKAPDGSEIDSIEKWMKFALVLE
ncbi:peroxidase family protein [Psychromarinibacter sp. S121]|uniref:peroxidase family protein n=1 Tax=Psychromarinibacter sp. S121 TaxID=3415127 RepID=UPI003C7B48B7